MGDSDSVRFRDGEYIEGRTSLSKSKTMKKIAISTSAVLAAVLGASTFLPQSADAGTCRHQGMGGEVVQICCTSDGYCYIK